MGIFLLRHGETEANLDGKYSGITNTNLTEFGRKQAEDVGLQLKNSNITKVYTSVLNRAIDTADIIVEQFKNKPERIITDILNERNFGIFENLYYNEVEQKLKVPFDDVVRNIEYRPTNGERILDVYARVINFYKTLEDSKDNILIVSHYAPVACILTYHHKYDVKMITSFDINNCQIFNIGN